MRILLFGEYSNLFNCIKDGLVALGHEVFLVSDGNSYRNYDSDFRYDLKIPFKRAKHLVEIGNIFLHKELISGYDVAMIIDPCLFSRYVWPNKIVFDYIRKHNTLTYVCGCGLYPLSFNYWYSRKDTKYYHFCKGYFEGKPKDYKLNIYPNKPLINWEKEFYSKITGYIPIWYEYAEPYRFLNNIKPTVRIPIPSNKNAYKPNVPHNGKITFFHGITRPCKGGKYIMEAFDRLRDKYRDKVEFIAEGGLPFKEYMQLMDRVNVLVDDANSNSFSMNVLYAMQKGIVCMGGAEPVGNKELGYEDCPVVNINNNVNDICSAIEDIISKSDQLEEWGIRSRNFVDKYHNSLDIARQYEQIFKEDLRVKELNLGINI